MGLRKRGFEGALFVFCRIVIKDAPETATSLALPEDELSIEDGDTEPVEVADEEADASPIVNADMQVYQDVDAVVARKRSMMCATPALPRLRSFRHSRCKQLGFRCFRSRRIVVCSYRARTSPFFCAHVTRYDKSQAVTGSLYMTHVHQDSWGAFFLLRINIGSG
eukprot:GEMP01120610.1.p1 GENE.GEMP01120610.1~~GEMP01120610.1.p1  ORF type:complete len:165 (+),score=14.17 GEMP01120610.1:91-585(+)